MNRSLLTSLLFLLVALSRLHAENDTAPAGASITLGEKKPLGIEATLSGVSDPALNGPQIITGFRDGRITFRAPKTGKNFFLKQSDFAESDLAKIREAIVPFQATVKGAGCQVDRLLNGNQFMPLWFNKGPGMKRPGDLGVNGIPSRSTNLRIRGLSTTYPFEVPARVIILWRGATAAPSSTSDETGFSPGMVVRDPPKTRCRRHFSMEDYDLTLQGTPCDLYSRPVYRCGVDQFCSDCCDRHVVVVVNRANSAVLYTNCTDASLVAAILDAEREGDAEMDKWKADHSTRSSVYGRKEGDPQDDPAEAARIGVRDGKMQFLLITRKR